MISQICSDRTLYGSTLLDLHQELWASSKKEIKREGFLAYSTKFLARKVLAPIASVAAFCSLAPIGFAAKVIHQGIRKIASIFFSTAATASLMVTPLLVTFSSPEERQKTFAPLSFTELERRMEGASHPLVFSYDSDLAVNKTIPLRNPGVGNLLQNRITEYEHLSVYYPQTPRVPHHLTIAMKRKDIKGISDISEEENLELLNTIKKISEIYKTIGISSYLVVQFDEPKLGHQDSYVVEVIPHLPNFDKIKNVVDKIDCNRYMLFREANLTPAICDIAQENIQKNKGFWQSAFAQETAPLTEEDISVSFPHKRYDSHEKEADRMLQQHLAEIISDKGGKVEFEFAKKIITPLDPPSDLTERSIPRCYFCDPKIINRQLVYEYNGIELLYNIRKGMKVGCNFLILPKNHTEKIYGLTEDEIHSIRIIRQALVEVLHEVHPDHQIIAYTQNGTPCGQTVLHNHEQIVSFDPENIALFWTLLSLYPDSNVSDEEMKQIQEEFGLKVKQKIEELTSGQSDAENRKTS